MSRDLRSAGFGAALTIAAVVAAAGAAIAAVGIPVRAERTASVDTDAEAVPAAA